MRIGSLFSGVGGLEMGLEWAGVGETQWQVECEPYPLDVLAKLWPTPTAGDAFGSGNRNLPGSKAHAGVSLTDAVTAGNSTTSRRKTLPTPVARDAETWKKLKRGANASAGGTPLIHAIEPNAAPADGGQLNPEFVEWLMGFPIGHTALERSEMQLSRKSRRSSGKSSLRSTPRSEQDADE